MKLLSAIADVLRRRNYFLLFVISGLLYGVLFSLMTNLIDVRFGIMNIKFAFTMQSILFFIALSFLGGLLVALQVFSFRQKQKNYSSTATGVSGMAVSFFATACPFCKPLLLSLISISGSLAILKYGILLAVGSVLLLTAAIYITARSITKAKHCENCK